MKRIVICADGTWNRPEENPKEDHPTNVLRISRAIKPLADGVIQVVFYDWGIGSYHDKVAGGAFGKGLDKNIMDCYRFIVHNYQPGDRIFLFGFSRGAYTIRSLSGLLNNCGVLKRSYASWIEKTYEYYRDPGFKPGSKSAIGFRAKYAVNDRGNVHFVGAFDTVGALGIPLDFFKFLDNNRYDFHDRKLGRNVRYARHALSIDEKRDDFVPTLWTAEQGANVRQVWFAGGHSDVGGGYARDTKDRLMSDDALRWIKGEAYQAGLRFEKHLVGPGDNDHLGKLHDEYKGAFKILGKNLRKIPGDAIIYHTVVSRYKAPRFNYRPKALQAYLKKTKNHWPRLEKAFRGR